MLVGSCSDDSAGHALTVADLTRPIRNEISNADLRVNPENVRGVLEDLDGLLVRSETSDFPQVMLKKDGWVLEDPALVRLFERLMDQGKPLSEFAKGRIYRGVTTGLNEAFVINEAKRQELIEEDSRSADLIKPWLRGRDIERWKADWAGLYVILTRRGVDIDEYPAIQGHLSWWRADLEPKATSGQQGAGRKPGDYQWYEIQDSVAYYHEFAHPKIIFNRFINSATFAYDITGAYHNDACYMVIPPSPSLAAIVNSTVGWWLLSHFCTPLQNGYIQVFVQFLEQLPIPLARRGTKQAACPICRDPGNRWR